MGRRYYGDINGTFWFALQNSDDASYFGVEAECHYEFHECGCSIEIYDPDDQLYCTSCYDSLEEHRAKIEDEQTWFLRELSFHFSKDDEALLQERLNELSLQVGQFMYGYTIEGDEEFTYDYTIPDECNTIITSEQRAQIARLCLGKLIAHCVSKQGECSFFAEI